MRKNGWSAYSIGADKYGRILFKNGKVYRVIMHGSYFPVLHGLIDDPAFYQRVIDAGLVRFKYFQLCGGLEHCLELEDIYSFSYMAHHLKRQNIDLLKMVCKLNQVLISGGLVACNFHDNDVNFKGCIPKFTDLGAIVKINPKAVEMALYRLGYLTGKYILGKKYQKNHAYWKVGSVLKHDKEYPECFYLMDRRLKANDKPELSFQEFHTFLGSYKLKERKLWCSYQEYFKGFGDYIRTGKLNEKEQTIYEMLKKYKSGNDTMFDVGCNKGLNMLTAATIGYKAMGCDIDDYSIASGYEFVKNHRFAETVHFLHCNLIDLFTQLEENETMKRIIPSNKYKSDLVLCSAFMHHWCKKNDINVLIQYLSELTMNTLIFEWIPGITDQVMVMKRFEDYGFVFLESHDSNVGRKILVFERDKSNKYFVAKKH